MIIYVFVNILIGRNGLFVIILILSCIKTVKLSINEGLDGGGGGLKFSNQ